MAMCLSFKLERLVLRNPKNLFKNNQWSNFSRKDHPRYGGEESTNIIVSSSNKKDRDSVM
jgi:hypothetical protein